jgi:competence protein ComEC
VAGAPAWILDQLDTERSRWMLWLPVALGLGIAIFFELPSEPALWLGPALAAVALALVSSHRPAASVAPWRSAWSPPPWVLA